MKVMVNCELEEPIFDLFLNLNAFNVYDRSCVQEKSHNEFIHIPLDCDLMIHYCLVLRNSK